MAKVQAFVTSLKNTQSNPVEHVTFNSDADQGDEFFCRLPEGLLLNASFNQ